MIKAKDFIQEGLVYLNGECETRRGKKCVPGDIITFEDQEVMIERKVDDH